ncbi:unnamed protein product [Peniophora sp. CBMAI 1063]|nr:unnamed protein product [Peniophora sp. CBMAI 1063]
MSNLLDLPEEILEIIIFLVFTPASYSGDGAKLVTLLPVLSVHSVFYRIGVPLLYRAISLPNSETAYLLCRTLDTAPSYAKHIRVLHAAAVFPSLPFILRYIALAETHLDVLSLALDAPSNAQLATFALKHAVELEAWSLDVGNPGLAICRAIASGLLQLKPGPREFVISRNRPPLPRDRERLQMLDAAIGETLPTWDGLRSIVIAFRLPGDSSMPAGLARAPRLERIRTPLPAVWHEALLIASGNPALKRLAVTVTHVKSRTRAGPVFVPVPGRVKDSWPSSFPAGIPGPPLTNASDATTYSSALTDATDDRRPSLANRLRAPVEIVSPFGTFHDRTERVLETEQHSLSRQQVLQDVRGGISAWLLEARKHPRLLELMLAESDTVENSNFEPDIVGYSISRVRVK